MTHTTEVSTVQYLIGITFKVEARDRYKAYEKALATIKTRGVDDVRTWGGFTSQYFPQKGDLVRINDKLGQGYGTEAQVGARQLSALCGKTLAITRLVRRPGQSQNVAAEVLQLKGSRRNLFWARDVTPVASGGQ